MGCRTRVMGNVYDPEREVTPGRGNLSFTSINLPRLAIRAKGDLDLFFDLLDAKAGLGDGAVGRALRDPGAQEGVQRAVSNT